MRKILICLVPAITIAFSSSAQEENFPKAQAEKLMYCAALLGSLSATTDREYARTIEPLVQAAGNYGRAYFSVKSGFFVPDSKFPQFLEELQRALAAKHSSSGPQGFYENYAYCFLYTRTLDSFRKTKNIELFAEAIRRKDIELLFAMYSVDMGEPTTKDVYLFVQDPAAMAKMAAALDDWAKTGYLTLYDVQKYRQRQ